MDTVNRSVENEFKSELSIPRSLSNTGENEGKVNDVFMFQSRNCLNARATDAQCLFSVYQIVGCKLGTSVQVLCHSPIEGSGRVAMT